MLNTDAEQHFLTYHLKLLSAFIEHAQMQPPFNLDDCSTEDRAFLESLQLLNGASAGPDFLIDGQVLLCGIVARYPHLMPLLYRDLLWFFGGDCLHFMPDEEILKFQQLDELRHTASVTGKTFSYEDARARIFGMH